MPMLMATLKLVLTRVQGVEWRNYLGFYSLRSHDTLKVASNTPTVLLLSKESFMYLLSQYSKVS